MSTPFESTLRLSSTDDVVVTGHRLEEITTLLGEGRLAAVRTQPERFSELSPTRASVRSIHVRPLKPEA